MLAKIFRIIEEKDHMKWIVSKLAEQAGQRRAAPGGMGAREDGADQRQLQSDAGAVRQIGGRQGAVAAVASRGQPSQDDAGAGHCDHRLRC